MKMKQSDGLYRIEPAQRRAMKKHFLSLLSDMEIKHNIDAQ